MSRTTVRAESSGIMSSLEIDSDAFMAGLARHIASLEIKTAAALWTVALRIQNDARIFAPVDTGRLRSSIMASREGESAVVIGTNVEYAAYVEFGTRHMAAQPYLRPALAHATGYLVQAVGSGTA